MRGLSLILKASEIVGSLALISTTESFWALLIPTKARIIKERKKACFIL
jgi:hypothetical protein